MCACRPGKERGEGREFGRYHTGCELYCCRLQALVANRGRVFTCRHETTGVAHAKTPHAGRTWGGHAEFSGEKAGGDS